MQPVGFYFEQKSDYTLFSRDQKFTNLDQNRVPVVAKIATFWSTKMLEKSSNYSNFEKITVIFCFQKIISH